MTDMIERVALAIYEGRNGRGCTPWARQTNAHREPYRSDARAAIEAMREPTPEMRLDGSYASGDLDGVRPATAGQIWHAMITAALASGSNAEPAPPSSTGW